MTCLRDDIIKGASYGIFAGTPTIHSPTNQLLPKMNTKQIVFYTHDGNPLVTANWSSNLTREDLSALLDPAAPQPQPASYRLIWWKPCSNEDYNLNISPGYMLLFHDKEGNRMGSLCLNGLDGKLSSFLFYDLSKAIEEPPDFSLNSNVKSEIKTTRLLKRLLKRFK